MKPYEPIECHTHDRLEDLAVRRRVCVVRYVDDAGQHHEAAGVIQDVYGRDGAEYLDLAPDPNGPVVSIRLDCVDAFEEL